MEICHYKQEDLSSTAVQVKIESSLLVTKSKSSLSRILASHKSATQQLLSLTPVKSYDLSPPSLAISIFRHIFVRWCAVKFCCNCIKIVAAPKVGETGFLHCDVPLEEFFFFFFEEGGGWWLLWPTERFRSCSFSPLFDMYMNSIYDVALTHDSRKDWREDGHRCINKLRLLEVIDWTLQIRLPPFFRHPPCQILSSYNNNSFFFFFLWSTSSLEGQGPVTRRMEWPHEDISSPSLNKNGEKGALSERHQKSRWNSSCWRCPTIAWQLLAWMDISGPPLQADCSFSSLLHFLQSEWSNWEFYQYKLIGWWIIIYQAVIIIYQ